MEGRVSEVKPVVRNLNENQGVRIQDQATGTVRSLRVFERIGNTAVLLVRESGDFMYKKRVRVDEAWKQVWPDLSVRLYRRPRGDWRFAFDVSKNLKLNRI
jgi:hypothetical protein